MFKEGQKYIANADSWFIEGSECYLDEILDNNMGIFEGKHKIDKLDTKTKWVTLGYQVGDIIDDREVCMFEEFDLHLTRLNKINEIL